MVQYLRFRGQPKSSGNKTYMTIGNIAKFLNRSATYVHRICSDLKRLATAKPRQTMEVVLTINQHLETEPISKHTFTTQQSRFLLSDRIMRLWSAKSISERVALTKRRFPYCHVTEYKLRKFYRINKVKKKKIRMDKILTARQLPNVRQDQLEYAEDVQSAVLQRFRII